MFGKCTYGAIVGLILSGCSTIPSLENRAQQSDLISAIVSENCIEAAKNLKAAGRETGAKTAFISNKGPRCDVANHVFAVNKHGVLRQVYEREVEQKRNGKQESDLSLIAVSTALQRYMEDDEFLEKKILIHIHGGLVSHKQAVEYAEIAAPWAVLDGYFPIFLIWDSSLQSTYLDYLVFTTDGERHAERSKVNIQDEDDFDNEGIVEQGLLGGARLLGNLGTGVFQAPENYITQFDNFYDRQNMSEESSYLLKPEDLNKSNGLSMSLPELNEDDFPFEKLNFDNSFWSPKELAYHATTPVRIVTTTFADAGKNSWDNMVRRTQLSVYSAENIYSDIVEADSPSSRIILQQELRKTSQSIQPNSKNNCVDFVRSEEKSGGFSQAMDLLNCTLASFETQHTPTITLAGHSMGAIVADEIIWSYPNLNYDKIIYLSAAISFRDFQRGTLQRLRAKEESQRPKFYNLMLHPLAEGRERHKYGLLPQGSLLEWIDEYFEGPRTLEEKMFGKYRNVEKYLDSLSAEPPNTMNFRVFPLQEEYESELCDIINTDEYKRCHPLKHGQLDDFTFWRDSYLGIDAK